MRELLHADYQRVDIEPAEVKRLCRQISKFFADKLRRIACEIETRLSVSTRSPPATRTASHATLSDFGVVTVDEVVKVIKLLPPKSSPLDHLPVLLLKASVYAMAPLLARLANLSFTMAFFHRGIN